jgi:hypothetical protein
MEAPVCVRVIGNDLSVTKAWRVPESPRYPLIGATVWRLRIAIISRSPLRLKKKTPSHQFE